MSFAEPFPEEIQEAKRHPNGWVYRIADQFGPRSLGEGELNPLRDTAAPRRTVAGPVTGACLENRYANS